MLLFPKDAACSLARRASKGVPRAAVLLFSKDAAWDLMGQVLGKVDEDFMADRNQPNRVDAHKPLGKRKGKRS